MYVFNGNSQKDKQITIPQNCTLTLQQLDIDFYFALLLDDHSRIILKPASDGSGYINANYIEASSSNECNCQKSYFALF